MFKCISRGKLVMFVGVSNNCSGGDLRLMMCVCMFFLQIGRMSYMFTILIYICNQYRS